MMDLKAIGQRLFQDTRETTIARLRQKAVAAGLGEDVRIECKFAIAELGLQDVGQREVIAFVSTEDPDMEKDVILAKGWDLSYFRKHPSVMLMHAYGELPMGTCRWIKEKDGKLIAKTWYIDRPADHPREAEWLPDTVLHYRQRGVMKGYSVGFAIHNERMPTEKEIAASDGAWDGCRIIDKALLLEYSDVPLPCNAEATQILVGKGWLPELEDQEADDGDDGAETKDIAASGERSVSTDPADGANESDEPPHGPGSGDPAGEPGGERVADVEEPGGAQGRELPGDGVEAKSDEEPADTSEAPEPEKAAPPEPTPAPNPSEIAHLVVLQQIAEGKFTKVDKAAIRRRVLKARIDDEMAYHVGNLGK